MKSDQNGIESLLRVQYYQGNPQSWNQTKMGLKARVSHLTLLTSFNCWNQTKMGLKVVYIQIDYITFVFVEIRPKLDWKKVNKIFLNLK